MTPVQIMALIVAILGGVKILVILVNPKSWLDHVVKPIYTNTIVINLLGLAIAGIALWFLIKEFTIVQIFAVMLFFMGLMLLGFAAYSKETLALATKILKQKDCIKRAWLGLIIWIVLIIWVFKELFF